MLRVLTLAVALALAVPGMAYATDGILLITHNSSAAWNAQMGELAAKLNKKQPTELALGAGTRATIEAGVERLRKRDVTSVTVVPLFMPAIAAEHVAGLPVPVRLTAGVADGAALTNLIVNLAEEVSRESSTEVLVLIGQGGTDWKVGLGPAAQSINKSRRFDGVIQIDKGDTPAPLEQEQLRRSFDRAASRGRRLVVVPLIAPATDKAAIDLRMQGVSHTLAKRGVFEDDAFAAMILELAAPPR